MVVDSGSEKLSSSYGLRIDAKIRSAVVGTPISTPEFE